MKYQTISENRPMDGSLYNKNLYKLLKPEYNKLMFRIEKNGIGPYRHCSIYPSQNLTPDLWMDLTHVAHQMPTPCQDEVLGAIYPLLESVAKQYPLDVLYCFTSEAHVRQYFSNSELKKLLNLGFEIKYYCQDEYVKCLFGSSQTVIFKTKESYDCYLKEIESLASCGYIPMF